ncbi:alpha-soluble NSF attachment protein-like protein [Tritrichomonas foetus]|uniref:Alpha-soluble NSF attachment protein-like protein n=1 Tax=Tritrichomonas foetus TaxID=1144522 RepID=A0A1J4L0Z8_9EUKA|nr:alpha-soluble NSF attachment protein-like protein [Tritrichomonas foetus]|eukprot:OHT17107.1 alpha-soluble NSF attachment protein-like protein [Tritrichomonas foetus]
MTLSPGDYYAEAEKRMRDISTDNIDKKYCDAAELFNKAGNSFSKVRNFTRAGDSFRRAVDCMLHIGKFEKVAVYAADAGRNYIKTADGEEKSFEAFNIALKAYNDMNKNVLADKLANEAAKIYEQSKKYDKAIFYHQQFAKSNKEQSKTQEYLRERKTICNILTSIKRWNEASCEYNELFIELSNDDLEKNALEYGVRSVLCLLAKPDISASRSLMDKYNSLNKSWEKSKESNFLNELIMLIVAKHYSCISTKGNDFGEEHGYDASFGKIISAISDAYLDNK